MELAYTVANTPDVVSEMMHFIGYSRRTFFDMTLRHTVPALVLSNDRPALETVAAIVGKQLGVLILDFAAEVLGKLFLAPSKTDAGLAFVTNLLRGLTHVAITPSSIMSTSMIPFVVALVIELGDRDETAVENATTALYRAHKEQSGSESLSADLGGFLKPHMLGVISQLNEILHDVQGKKSVEFKRKVIRSMARLISLVGDSMSSFSPQVGVSAATPTVLLTARSSRAYKALWVFPNFVRKHLRPGAPSSRHCGTPMLDRLLAERVPR